MPVGRVTVRNMVRDMAIAGDGGFEEILLAVIKGGALAVRVFMEEMGQETGADCEGLTARARAAVLKNPMRYLECGLQSLPAGPELDALMSLLGRGPVRDLVSRYEASSSFSKTFRCTDWLVRTQTPAEPVDDGLLLIWAAAWLEDSARCDDPLGALRARSDDVELYLMEIADGSDAPSVLRALELLASLQKSLGRIQEFGVTTLRLLGKAPDLAGGPLGRALCEAISAGEFTGGGVPPPPATVINELSHVMAEDVTRVAQAQLDSVSQIVGDLLRHADSIQEWNEWVLTEHGFSPDLIASKIMEEARSGHRRAVSLTRHLQTAEEAELRPCDTYPILLDTLAFSPSVDGRGLSLDLPRDLPQLLCDESLLKIGLSEFMAFVATDVQGAEPGTASAVAHPDGHVEVSLSVLCLDGAGVGRQFETSLSRATLERVMRAHGGSFRLDVAQKGACLTIRLPAAQSLGGLGDAGPRLAGSDGFGRGDWVEALLVETARRGGDVSQEITRVLSILVHDMKNAFSFIQSWSDGLRAGGKDAARSVTRIRENIARLRDSARDAGTMLSLNSEPRVTFEDVVQVVESVLGALQASAGLKQVGIGRAFQDGMPRVPMDRGRLESLVANLVKNSLEATAPGGLIAVEVGTDSSRGILRLVVSDTGLRTGTLVDPSPAMADGLKVGTGVGLLAARRIASSHGGALELQPREGGGMVARFEMPIGEEERLLAKAFPFRRFLGDETVKALRAGTHFQLSGEDQTSVWLLVKALEVESLRACREPLPRHILAPAALEWTKGASKARTVSPALSAHLDGYAAEVGIEAPILNELKGAAALMLWDIGRGQWEMDCSKHLEMAALILVFCVPERSQRRSPIPTIALPNMGPLEACNLASAYAQVHAAPDPARVRAACSDGLRLLAMMDRLYVSGSGGGGVT